MHILVTAGNTLVPIDKVRCITNVFTGRTGAGIAACAHRRGHDVTLATSHPDVATAAMGVEPSQVYSSGPLPGGEGKEGLNRWYLLTFRTFADLHDLLARLMPGARFDAVIHCAAVSDFRTEGIYAPSPATRFRPDQRTWETADGSVPRLEDRAAGKVKSDAGELWLRLVRTPKLIDFFRQPWGFRGLLVKFKLETGVTDAQLLEIAERSRLASAADLMVANTLEGAASWAYLGPLASGYQRTSRGDLAQRLLQELEERHEEAGHG